MKFTCSKRLFHEALQSVSRAIATRSTLPILSHVYLEARGDQLKLVTTDLEIGMTCTLPVGELDEAGAITVPERILQDVVANLPDAELELESNERNLLTLKAGTSQYTIHGLPAEEFPVLPSVPQDAVISLPGPVLRDLIRKTQFAASTDESRLILTGCLLAWDGQLVTMAATDTHRLAVKRVPVGGQFTKDVAAIIPARALQEVLRLLGSSEDPVSLYIGDNQILFVLGRVQLVSRLIEGTFPAYDRVIPQDLQKRLKANRQELYEAVRRAAVVARAESNKIVFHSAETTLTLEARSGEVGDAHEEIPIALEGDPVEIAFNAAYLQDVLAVLDTEAIELNLGGPLSPGLLRGDGEPDYLYVVMPMQML